MTGARRKPSKRMLDRQQPDINAFRARHLALAQREIATEFGSDSVVVDEGESPLAWLARRRGRDGRGYIEPHQLQAGERLRADFSCANLLPRTTSNWGDPISSDKNGNNRARDFTEIMVAARRRVHRALDTVGPEFAGLLLDVCCFLKRLEDIERERTWPARSAKVVLQLALDRLARHYGYAAQATGPAHAAIRTWLQDGAAIEVDGEQAQDSSHGVD